MSENAWLSSTGRDWAFGPDYIKRAKLFRTFFLASTLRRSRAPTRHASAGEPGTVWSLHSLLRGQALGRFPQCSGAVRPARLISCGISREANPMLWWAPYAILSVPKLPTGFPANQRNPSECNHPHRFVVQGDTRLQNTCFIGCQYWHDKFRDHTEGVTRALIPSGKGCVYLPSWPAPTFMHPIICASAWWLLDTPLALSSLRNHINLYAEKGASSVGCANVSTTSTLHRPFTIKQ